MRRMITTIAALLLLGLPVLSAFAGGQDEAAAGEGEVAEIDWFVNETWYTHPWDAEDKPVDSIITDRLGVKINFESSGGQGEKLNAMIAGGDLPDVLSMGWWYGQVQQLQESGMLVKLDEAIPEHAPDLWEDTPESMVGWWQHDDGHLYGYPNMTWWPEDLTEENYLNTNAGFVARRDIMEDLDIDPAAFQTKDGMIEALKKVQESDYSYNGLDVTPFWMTTNGGMPGDFIWQDAFAVQWEDEEGNLLDPRRQSRYLEHLLFLNRLYREGLLKEENFTIDRNQTVERIISGRVFAMPANTSDYRVHYERLYTADNDAVYLPVGPVRSDDGVEPQLRATGTTGWLLSMISEDSPYVERILKLWEFLHSREGLLLTDFGVEGEHYTMGDDGRVQWTDSYMEMLNNPDVKATHQVGNRTLWFLRDAAMHQRVKPAPATRLQEIGEDVFRYFAEYTFDNAAFTNLGPAGGTDLAGTASQIATYWEEQLPKMVLADSADEARRIYEESVARIEEMGADEVLAAQNEKFQDNKAKLGVRHAWPPLRDE